jgi:hypothetical protein
MTRRTIGAGMLLGVLAASLLGSLAGCATQHIHIDWVNFIRFQRIEYLASYHTGRELQPSDLGAQFATVRFRLSDNVDDPNYQTQDGEAAYLAPGTPVYRVAGYASTFRLAAYQGERIVLFEADTNPQAKRGADLLDIRGKVGSITVEDNSGTTTTVLATIQDARQVAALVALLLAAPVDQARQLVSDGPRYALTFHLADGTETVRQYLPDAREVERGIIVPAAFVSMLSAAIGK